MNRLQKKCLIATAGFHLLLLVILLVGPAFFAPKPKMDDSQVLDVIPSILVDAAFNSGIKNVQPPPQTPIAIPQPQPTPPAPKIVQSTPQPTLVQRFEKLFTPEPVKPTPTEVQPHKVQPNLTPTVRTVPKNSASKPKQNPKAVDDAIKNLRTSLSSPTAVAAPGDSDAAVANYASAVKSIYDAAWNLPDSVANDDENVKVSVTIASDGTVTSSHIVTASGDAPVDATVQHTLDRVQFIAPFPEGSTDKERTYIINFNPKAKRMLE